MSSPDQYSPRLVADVGGTHTRIARYDPATGQLQAAASYINRDYRSLEEVISRWLDAAGPAPLRDCCIAVAAPPSGDRVSMVNIDWSFSLSELAERCGFRRLRCINDFQSNAYALPYLSESDMELLHPGGGEQPGRLATLGPGTGLGGAILEFANGSSTSYACEPGHMGLSAGTLLELEIFRLLLQHHEDIYAELLVSGPGLQRLYHALGEINAEPTQALSPADISSRALNNQDDLCELALGTFYALLGSICGDFLLANGAYGGLYLAGGIIPGMIPFLRRSDFQDRLARKGAMRERLDAVPVYVITAGHPGLIGAAHAPL